MLGKVTLYLPGYDHAGIATQSVVEKRLFKTTGKTRHDLGRTEFLKKVTEWKDESAMRSP
jgi:valyl-tRNA synthetase